jgi:hypothetical protein
LSARPVRFPGDGGEPKLNGYPEIADVVISARSSGLWWNVSGTLITDNSTYLTGFE